MYQKYVVEKESTVQIAKELGVHFSTVSRYIHKYDFKINSFKMQLSDSTEKNIVEYYISGNNIIETSTHFKVGKDIIKRVLNKYNIKIEQHPIRKKYNAKFFSEYTPQTCYWAGFIAADGNIHNAKNRLSINISNTDINHLEKFVHQIGYEGIIHHQEATCSHSATCRIDLGGEEIVNDLKNFFGIMPKKTLTISLPENIPYYLWSHYFRGYADGDGCISFSDNRPHFSVVSGSTIMINQWLNYLYNKGIRINNNTGKPSIVVRGECKSINYYGLCAKQALDILYEDSYDDIRLDRKYDKYLEVVNLLKQQSVSTEN